MTICELLVRSQPLNAFNCFMMTLNIGRGTIAHYVSLADDELLRFLLTVKDSFRLIGKES